MEINKWNGCWIGCIIDNLDDDKIVYKSRPVMTWEEAHKRASRQSIAKLSRYAISVVDSDFYK
jgi:hypothetical protein